MRKDPKELINYITEEYKSYVRKYDTNDVGFGISYFDGLLREFYDESSLYFLNRYNNEMNKKLDFNDSLRWYKMTFKIPDIYLYNNYLRRQDSPMPILDQIVYETREFLCSPTKKAKEGDTFDTEQFCGLASIRLINIAKKKNIKADILTTSKTFGLFDEGCKNRGHAFSLVVIDEKKYIIDCTFSQFTKLFFMTDHAIKLPFCINAEPAYFLNKSEKGRKLLEQILKYGYFEANKENLKLYLDSFVLSERNAYFYLNGGNINDTKINSSYYFNILNDTQNKKPKSYEGICFYPSSLQMPSFFGDEEELGAKQDCYLTKNQLKIIDKMIKS